MFALGLVAIHQQPGLAAHLAVEIFHAQRIAAFRPVAKFGDAGDETVVGEDNYFAVELVGPFLDGLLHPPFARFHHVDAARIMAVDSAGDFAGEAAGIAGIVQLHVINCPAGIAQFAGEVAHRREDQRDLLLVVFDVGCLFPDLHHQDDGIILRAPPDRREVSRQLVAQDGDEDWAIGASMYRKMPCAFNAGTWRQCRTFGPKPMPGGSAFLQDCAQTKPGHRSQLRAAFDAPENFLNSQDLASISRLRSRILRLRLRIHPAGLLARLRRDIRPDDRGEPLRAGVHDCRTRIPRTSCAARRHKGRCP